MTVAETFIILAIYLAYYIGIRSLLKWVDRSLTPKPFVSEDTRTDEEKEEDDFMSMYGLAAERNIEN